jgi:hypothetical protein
VGAGQRLTGAGSAVLALAAGGPYTNTTVFSHSLCYQTAGSATLISFEGANYTDGTIGTTRADFPVAATIAPNFGAATVVTVGYCVINQTSGVASNNDYVNGWVHVTN